MNSFLETLRKFGAARLAVMASIMLGLLLFFVFVVLRLSAPSMKMLYTELAPNDSSAIGGALEEAKITYEVSADGSKVMVPGNEVGRARMLLAQKGLPNGGSLGYELFDQQAGFGTTEFVQNINQLRALEGELERTVGSLEAVRVARVHVVLPQREMFAREKKQAKASVLLDLKAGSMLEREQVLAIQSLVAAAVPDLRPSSVTVVDSQNNLLAGGEEEGDKAVAAHRSEDARRDYEATLARKIEDQVGRVVGFDKVRAIVTADMNFDRTDINEERYDPSGQVVRSSQTTEASETKPGSSSASVSVQNNLPGLAPEIGAGAGQGQSNNTQEVTNYEISRTVRSTVSQGGGVKRLSVSVLVDGLYTPQPADKDGKVPDPVYKERDKEELDRIGAMVRSAIGFDAARGDVLEVVNMRFATLPIVEAKEETDFMGMKWADLSSSFDAIILSVVAVLVVLLIVQPMISRLVTMEDQGEEEVFDAELLATQALPVLAAPEERALPAHVPEVENEESLINIAGVAGKVKASALKKVEKIVQNYPSESVSVIRSWMTQDSSRAGE